MEHDFPDLVPLFVGEARERLERLAILARSVESDPQAIVEARRELHTLKGASRMMRFSGFAELCNAGETLLKSPRDGMGALLERAADRLAAMTDGIERGDGPGTAPELVALLERTTSGAGEEPPSPAGESTAPARVESSAEPAHPGAGGSAPPPQPGQPPHVEGPALSIQLPPAGAPSTAPGPATGGSGELRLEADDVDALAERATRLRILTHGAEQFVHRLYDLAHFAEQGVREPMPAQVLALLASNLRRAAVDLEGAQRRLRFLAERQFDDILGLQLQPLRPYLLSLSRHARELARSLGREVEVELSGEETRLDRRIARELEGALLHLVRNAVDHGLEPPEQRRECGKPAAGRLRLEAGTDGDRVRLVVADDGAGIDLGAVRAAAVRTGLTDAANAEAMSRDEAMRLLFRAGFSTRAEVSELSGRGIGLDVVWSAVSRVGGEVHLDAEPGHGTRVVLEVPVARRGEHVLLLRVGRLRVAIPRPAVERVTRIERGAVFERGDLRLARVGPRLVPFVLLGELVGERPTTTEPLLVEGTISGQGFALAVDDVEGEEEVLVRPVGRLLAGNPLLDGLALVASGEPVAVLSLTRLARGDVAPAPAPPPERAPPRRLRVLLVDDSLVTREMERRLLADAGFEVTGAADADEALTHLAEDAFDCVVTDIEMPGMDGFELTRHLRGMPHLAHLPVVVVSTRDRPEDRLRGLEAGADAYLTKQGLDAGELVGVVRRLAAA